MHHSRSLGRRDRNNKHEDKKVNDDTLGDILTALSDAFTKERHKTEPYKEMFKAGSSHTGLLRELHGRMISHVFDACDVYKKRHGVTINANQYHILLALPLLVKIAEQNAKNNEGLACCVDKAYFMLSEQLKALAAPSPSSEETQGRVVPSTIN